MNYTTAYTYNLAGEVVNMTYPSGRVVKHEYDAIGRVEHVKNNSTGATYAGSATYSAANQLTGFSYLNGISASFGYSSDRLPASEHPTGPPVFHSDGGYGGLFHIPSKQTNNSFARSHSNTANPPGGYDVSRLSHAAGIIVLTLRKG